MINLSDKTVSLAGLTALSKGLSFVPTTNYDEFNTYMEIFSNKREYKVFNNLTKDERIALLDLRNVKTIIVKPADKGGSIVVMNFANCEVERQVPFIRN